MTAMSWDAVRQVAATELAAGDQVVNPSLGTAYRAAPDGTVTGAGIAWPMPLTGRVWTVVANDGATVTGRLDTGAEISQPIPSGATVLRINA